MIRLSRCSAQRPTHSHAAVAGAPHSRASAIRADGVMKLVDVAVR